MARLQAVPDTPPRAVLYLRQSVSRDDSISLELQEAAGRDYAARAGYTVVAVESDPGVSGRTWNRPAVQRVMAMIEDGQADVIVLWKWSRLSRSRRDWAVAVDRVEVAGGRIESATEAVDVTTATGRLARGVLAEFAAFESDRIGEIWKDVHRSRLSKGLAPSGKPKFGYVWNPESKIHQPDPETGPYLAEAYRRYVAGASVFSLVRWLNGAHVATINGGAWSDRTLRRVMDTGFAAGYVNWGGQLHEGVHDRLIDRHLWQDYLDARAERRKVPARVKRSQYLLSGLVRCGRCHGAMVANNPNDGVRAPSFRCAKAKEQGITVCAGGYVAMHVVEAAVMEHVRAVAGQVDEAADSVGVQEAKRLDAEAEITRLSRRIVKVEESVTALTLRLGEGLIPAPAYSSAIASLSQEKADLQARADELGREVRRRATRPVEAAVGLLAEWHLLPVEGRRAMLGLLIDHVTVVTGGRTGGASNAQVTVVER